MELPIHSPELTQHRQNQVDPVHALIVRGEGFLAQSLLAARIQSNPNNPEDIYRLSRLLLAREKYKEAGKCFQQLVRIEDSARAWAGLGDVYFAQNDFEGAKNAYLDSLLRFEGMVQGTFEVHKNLGNVFVRLGDFEMAEDFYNKAHTINPKSDVLAVNYGTLAIQRGDHGKAVLKFRQALQININNDKAWVGLALSHQQYGDAELAWANLQMAVSKNPYNRTALLLLAQWAHRDSNHVAAIQPLLNFVENQDYDEQISLLLIESLIQIKNYQMANIEIERALCWNPESQAVMRLAEALRESGN